ncbi:MAG TPA: hypothetical protein VGD79_00720, partial [Thermoanaerobaculia bacterium]
MARKCFMCGGEVSDGILCSKCDKPRRKSGATQPIAETAAAPEPSPAPQPAHSPRGDSGRHGVVAAQQIEDPFPKAPVVQFPVESASPAITSVVNLLVATGGASILIGPDRSVKFVSDDAKRLFDATQAELAQLSAIEKKAGIRVGDLSVSSSAGVRVGNRNFIYTLVPMSDKASGAALIFHHTDPMNEAHASFVTYV